MRKTAKDYYTISEFARLFQVHPFQVELAIAKRKIRAVTINGKTMIPKSEAIRILKRTHPAMGEKHLDVLEKFNLYGISP